MDFRKLGIKRSNMCWYLRVKTAGRSLGLLRLFNEYFLGNEKLFDLKLEWQ